MSQLQKFAWWILGVFAAGVVLYSVGLFLVGPLHALGVFGICGLWAVGMLFLRKNKSGKITWDERDEEIWRKSLFVAHITFWGVFVLACMVPWMVLGPKATIPVDVLPKYVGGGMIWIGVVQALTILGAYGRKGRHASE